MTRRRRSWTLLYNHRRFGNTGEGPFYDKAAAIAAATRRAAEHGVPVRVSTPGHFGSLTVHPEGTTT
jgi:hypothetical protein